MPFSELRVKKNERCHRDGQKKPDVKVEQQVPEVVMVGLCSEDTRSSIFTSKDIIKDKTPWNNHKLTVEKGVDSSL